MVIAIVLAAALAQYDPTGSFQSFGSAPGWTIYQSKKSDTCSTAATFEGDVELSFYWFPRKDTLSIFIHDPKLKSIENDKDYEIEVIFNKSGRLDQGWGKRQATGDINEDGVHGFVLALQGKVALTDVAASTNISFWYKDKMVDVLNLSGSAAMIAEIRRCASQLIAAHPLDPFED